MEHFHVARVGCRTVRRLRCDLDHMPHDLCQRCVFGVGEPGSILVVGKEEVPQSPLPGQSLEVSHLRGRLYWVLDACHLSFMDDGFGRVHILVHECEKLFLILERSLRV